MGRGTGTRTPRRPRGRPTAAAPREASKAASAWPLRAARSRGRGPPPVPSSLPEGCLGLDTGSTGEVSQC